MQECSEETIERFYTVAESYIRQKMPYRDAIEIAAVTIGGLIPAKVSHAMIKHQEAMHPRSHLYHEPNKDALALLSMGVLWDNEYFQPVPANQNTPLENTLAESIYFIMSYAKEEDSLIKALQANSLCSGDAHTRAKSIQRILGII
jgi:hypothetical protein